MGFYTTDTAAVSRSRSFRPERQLNPRLGGACSWQGWRLHPFRFDGLSFG